MLLADIPGGDLYDAERSQLLAMVDLLVDLQTLWFGRVDELLSLGLPDWRGPALSKAISDVVERTRHELDADDRQVLDVFVRDLSARFEEYR